MIAGKMATYAKIARQKIARPLLGRAAKAAALIAVLCAVSCSKPTDKKEADEPKAPSAAEVQRNAVADFEAPQAGLSAPNPKAAFDGPFTAGGMEPFWSAKIVDGKLTLERPEAEPVTIAIGRLTPQNGVAKVKKNKLTVIVSAQPCTDSAGAQVDYRMLLIYDADAYEGCARVGDAPAKSDWSAFIDDFLPAIDGCIQRARSQNLDVRVTVAYPRTHGRTGVRLSSGPEGRFECDAETKTGIVKFFDPIGEEDVLPGEWTPLFTRAPGSAPMGNCSRNVPVKSAKGEPLGWATYESC